MLELNDLRQCLGGLFVFLMTIACGSNVRYWGSLVSLLLLKADCYTALAFYVAHCNKGEGLR